MNQKSFAGPVILVILGCLILLNNLHPDFSIWRNIWHYWPFLLITFGVVRLAEVLTAAAHGDYSVPGGPVVGRRRRRGNSGLGLLLLICGIFWFAGHNPTHSMHVANWVHNDSLEIFGERFDYPVSTKGSAAGVTLLLLDGVRGNITLTGGDGDEYSAEGRKTVHSYNRSEADEANRRSEIKFVHDGNQLVLKMDAGRVSSDRKISADLDIRVPRGVNVEARGRSGDLTLSSITGSLDLASDRGDIRLNDLGGSAKVSVAHSGLIRVTDAKSSLDLDGSGSDVQIENIKGPVTVNGSFSGTLEFKGLESPLHFQSPQTDMRVESLPGSLKLDLGDLRVNRVEGPMRVHTKSRDIHIEEFSGPLEVDISARGDLELSTNQTPLGKIDVHTRNGNIDLALPGKADFDLRADTRRGEAHNEFGPSIKLEIEGRAASLKSVDGGGAAVVANTDRGSVSVRKSSSTRD